MRLLSSIYRLAWHVRRAVYRACPGLSRALPVPVLSVGNIVVGGVGKTPFVAAVCRALVENGHRPGILSRGYGRVAREDVVLTGSEHTPEWHRIGDEPSMLYDKLHLPLGVGPDRARTARALLNRVRVDCLVLDDAFQHWAVKRDVNLVVLDALTDEWVEPLLPSGRMREPVAALSRADAFLVVDEEEALRDRKVRQIRERLPGIPCFAATPRVVGFHDLSSGNPITGRELEGGTVVALAGIANPKRFQKTLERIGITVSQTHWFRDHFAYAQRDIDRILRGPGNDENPCLVTTAKDAQRLKGLNFKGKRVVVLETEMNIIEKDEFIRWLLKSLWKS